jgi:hypothetical protein
MDINNQLRIYRVKNMDDIDRIIQDIIIDLKTRKIIIDADIDTSFIKYKPCGFVAKRINIFHEHGNGYTWSPKIIYINSTTFEYYWRSGGFEIGDKSIKQYLDVTKETIKETLNLDAIIVDEIKELEHVAYLTGYKKKSETTEGQKIQVIVIQAEDGTYDYFTI